VSARRIVYQAHCFGSAIGQGSQPLHNRPPLLPLEIWEQKGTEIEDRRTALWLNHPSLGHHAAHEMSTLQTEPSHWKRRV